MDASNNARTKSCYLDGRYISLVLRDVPEFIPEPIIVEIPFDVDGKMLAAHVRSGFFSLHDGMNIVRVIVRSTYMAHSALLWIDTTRKIATYTDTVSSARDTEADKVHPVVDELLRTFVSTFTKYSLVVERIPVPDSNQTDCDVYGFCNAYVIKQVQDYTNDVVFDPYSFDVLEFAGDIEREYFDLLDPLDAPDVEYAPGRGGGGYRGGGGRGGGYRGGGGWGRGGWGRGGWGGGYGWGGAGLGLLGGVALGTALGAAAAQPYYAPGYYAPVYGAPVYPYPYGYGSVYV